VFGMPSVERCMIEFWHLGLKMELENAFVYYDNIYRHKAVFCIRWLAVVLDIGTAFHRRAGIVQKIPSRLGVGMAHAGFGVPIRFKSGPLDPFKAQPIANLCAGDARGRDGSPTSGSAHFQLSNVSNRCVYLVHPLISATCTHTPF
jgi:hypothetical protein